MKLTKLIIIGMVLLFVAALGFVLWREVRREEATLAASISGTVDVSPQLVASGQMDIVRTDRLVLMLVDPETRRPVALHFESPLVPPQTIRIGQADARGEEPLKGPYLVVGITDKDGEIFKVTPGEVYGRSPQPVPLGSETFKLVLDAPFRGTLFNEAQPPMAAGGAGGAPAGGAAGGAPSRRPSAGSAGPLDSSDADPRFSITGTITVAKGLQGSIDPADRIVILLFDPAQQRPVAFKIIPHTLLPQRFSITLPPEARGNVQPGYNLRVLTDKNNDPFGSAPGEVIGRSAKPIPLGTADLNFVLDQPYQR